MLAHLPAARLRQTVLLTDCMSPVTGFETAGHEFLQRARQKGVLTTSLNALAGIPFSESRT
jgi:hypothetical protein